MGIKEVTRPVNRVMGADCSTQSFAFSIFDDGALVQWGEVFFVGRTVFERLADGQRKVRALKKELQIDKVVIESAVFVQNKKTVILLAYAFGAIMAALIDAGAEVQEISPLVWQRWAGNPPLTKAEKLAIVNETPSKSVSWYQTKYREFRKQRNVDNVNAKFGIHVASDNVADAISIGDWAVHS